MMKISLLLEELLKISNVSKTDYALALHMTSSGLSKILSGARFPLWKERKLFSRQSAVYFSEAIFSYCSYLKFKNIFPVIYDFNSKRELELFLTYALDYALEYDYMTANHESMEYPDHEISYLGNQQVLNMLCIILSDCITSNKERVIEIFDDHPFKHDAYSEIFPRILYPPSNKKYKIKFHLYLNMDNLKLVDDRKRAERLLLLIKSQRLFDLIIHPTNGRLKTAFLLIKGKYLLYFNTLIDGIPFMTVIRQKNYQTIFYNSLMKKNYNRISYSPDELLSLIKEKTDLKKQIQNMNFEYIYNASFIGYFLTRRELDQLNATEEQKDFVYNYFQRILKSDLVFAVTIDALSNFYTTGKALVPLLGYVQFPLEERIAYLRRFDTMLLKENPNKIRILDQTLPNAAIACSGNFTFIYLSDLKDDPEKIHIFETEYLNQSLNNALLGNRMQVLDFSPELWNNYLEKISSG